MKKILLALLATCLMQTPMSAVLTEVSVLTKDDHTVYLYGDVHVDLYGDSLRLSWDFKEPEAVYARRVAFYKDCARQQVARLRTRIAQLGQVEDVRLTIMPESDGMTPEVKLVCEALLKVSETKGKDTSICRECRFGCFKVAREILLVMIKPPFVPTMVAHELPESVDSHCIDSKRKKVLEFINYCTLLWLLHTLQAATGDCLEAKKLLQELMGHTSWKDLGLKAEITDLDPALNNDPDASLFAVVSSLFQKKNQQFLCSEDSHCFGAEGKWKLDTSKLEILFKSEFFLTEPQIEAALKITALANEEKPSKVVVVTGAYHKHILSIILEKHGFAVQEQLGEGSIASLVKGPLPFQHCLTEEEVDVFGIDEPVVQEIPRPSRPSWWKRILYCR